MVVRADLSPAQQAVQAAHALQEFNMRFAAEARQWFETSNTLALLSVVNEHALGVLVEKANDQDITVAAFREPDRGDELTAIALGPHGKRITRRLPKALNDSSQKDTS